jgi:glutathione S-transferase
VNPEESDYGRYLNFLHFGEATLTFPLTLVLRYGRFEPKERQLPQVVEDYSRWFLARLRAIGNSLVTDNFLCAQRFTAADISVGYALMLAEYIGLSDQFSPPAASYWERLKARPSYERALRAQQQASIRQGVPATPSPLVINQNV